MNVLTASKEGDLPKLKYLIAISETPADVIKTAIQEATKKDHQEVTKYLSELLQDTEQSDTINDKCSKAGE